ncbi:DUF4400 domain-containing protein [Azonexus hydrophilus]|uniref:DUF4400 domain-containing protein n=1 Tax=Azonexus hydrophilus TaxID=418702 RepID=A0ABZ2XQI2_9RHOO
MMMWKHIGLWIVALILAAFALPALMSQEQIMGHVMKELGMIERAMGKASTKTIMETAAKMYSEAFVKTGVIQATQKVRVTEDEQRGTERLFGGQLVALSDFTNEYIRGVAAMFYAASLRLVIMMTWMAYILPFGIAIFADGFAQRKVKLATFGYSNPQIFNAARHTLVVMLMFPIFYLIVPIALTPLVIPFWAMVATLPTMIMVRHTQRLSI